MKRIDTPSAAAELLRAQGFTIEEDHLPPAAASAPAAEAKPARRTHSWLKLRVHVYICRTCGAGKVNALAGKEWVTTYHLPDGSSVTSAHTPPCEIGPKTEIYLQKYADEIAAAPIQKPRARAKASA